MTPTSGLVGRRTGARCADPRRLRQAGLIRQLPHTNHHVLTDDGIRVAVFYTKIYNRLLVPLTGADQPHLRAALKTITACVDDYAARARIPRASQNLTQTSRT